MQRRMQERAGQMIRLSCSSLMTRTLRASGGELVQMMVGVAEHRVDDQ